MCTHMLKHNHGNLFVFMRREENSRHRKECADEAVREDLQHDLGARYRHERVETL